MTPRDWASLLIGVAVGAGVWRALRWRRGRPETLVNLAILLGALALLLALLWFASMLVSD